MGYDVMRFLSYFGDKTCIFFGKSDWPAGNSKKPRLAGMPAAAGNLPPMAIFFLYFW